MQQNSFNLCSDTENVHQIYIQLLKDIKYFCHVYTNYCLLTFFFLFIFLVDISYLLY